MVFCGSTIAEFAFLSMKIGFGDFATIRNAPKNIILQRKKD